MSKPGGSRTAALAALLKKDESVPRTHSLYDMETDQVLQHNTLRGKLPNELKASKYKICGSFILENQKNQPKSGSTFPLQQSTNSSSLGPALKNSMLNINLPQSELSTLQKASESQIFNVNNPKTPDGMSALHRQSLLDFNKAMQYLNQNPIPSYSNLLLQNFTSPNSSLSSILAGQQLMNSNSFFQLPTPGSQADNHFDISNVREVEEVDDNMNQGGSIKRKFAVARGGMDALSGRSKKRGKWSDLEDRVLQDLANKFLERNEKINFKKLAEHLPGRSAKQCREHWLSTLNPELKKGRWTKAEEIQLLDLMVAHGKSWSIISKHIEGRAEHSVKAKGRLLLGERLKTVPNNAIAYDKSEAHKNLLVKLHQDLGNDFDEISKQSGFIISPAKIERTVMSMCTCAYCVTLSDKVKATGAQNLLQGWTMVKANQIKNQMFQQGSKYSSTSSENDSSAPRRATNAAPERFVPKLEVPTDDAKLKLSGFSRLSQYQH